MGKEGGSGACLGALMGMGCDEPDSALPVLLSHPDPSPDPCVFFLLLVSVCPHPPWHPSRPGPPPPLPHPFFFRCTTARLATLSEATVRPSSPQRPAQVTRGRGETSARLTFGAARRTIRGMTNSLRPQNRQAAGRRRIAPSERDAGTTDSWRWRARRALVQVTSPTVGQRPKRNARAQTNSCTDSVVPWTGNFRRPCRHMYPHRAAPQRARPPPIDHLAALATLGNVPRDVRVRSVRPTKAQCPARRSFVL